MLFLCSAEMPGNFYAHFQERRTIPENNKWGIKKRFENGTYKLGYVPYGYRWENGEIIVDPEQAVIVKRIFSELLAGKGTDAIAKSLNAENVPTKKGGRWTSTSIRGILANEKYTGDCIFQKTYTDSNFNRHKNAGQFDQYYVADHHEAIISHEDFDAAATLIEQRANAEAINTNSVMHFTAKSAVANVATPSADEFIPALM